MTNLEELLNKLIAKWRKPRGSEIERLEIDEDWFISYGTDPLWNYWWCPFGVSMNDLCSLDSWLWQFVVKNGLYNKNLYWNIWVKYPCEWLNDTWLEHDIFNHTYWIMLSSIQENKEDFILSNIKLDD